MELPNDILQFMKTIGEMPRHLVSDGYEQAMTLLLERAEAAGFQTILHKYPTGHDCGTWIVPPKWTLNSARLLDMDGNILIDAADNGLHCMSYSQPFSGTVSKKELFDHLYTHANIPDAIPFTYSYYSEKWGLCCSEDFKKTLGDEEYRVEIDTEFHAGHMSVGEIIVPGKLQDSFVLASHLCHPHQLNDGPIGSIIGIEVLKELRKKGCNYTFRQLIMPETIGSAAWISSNEHLLPFIKGGLFCEMLTNDVPFVLNNSFMNDSLADALFKEIVMNEASDNKCERFNYGNDERQFNGPGVQVPMQALHRSNMSRHQKGQYDAYPEYHSNHDDMRLVTEEKVSRAARLITSLLRRFDDFLVIPKAQFKGEPFLSRYDLQRDHIKSFGEFMDVVNMCDRELTVFEAAHHLGLSPNEVLQYLAPLIDINLVEYKGISNR